MINNTDPLHALMVAEQQARSAFIAALHQRIAADASTIAHLKAKLAAAEKCQRCAAVETARALAGVETVRL